MIPSDDQTIFLYKFYELHVQTLYIFINFTISTNFIHVSQAITTIGTDQTRNTKKSFDITILLNQVKVKRFGLSQA